MIVLVSMFIEENNAAKFIIRLEHLLIGLLTSSGDGSQACQILILHFGKYFLFSLGFDSWSEAWEFNREALFKRLLADFCFFGVSDGCFDPLPTLPLLKASCWG